MGKFDGMLLISDFDNTLYYTEAMLRGLTDCTLFSPRNEEQLHYWMAEGGRFAVATGRAMTAYRTYSATVPSNAPTIVDNGGAIYDYSAGEYLVTSILPDGAREHIKAIMEAFPGVALELYHNSDLLQAMNPTEWNYRHAKNAKMEMHIITDLEPETVPLPLSKALFVTERARLEEICRFAEAAGWRDQYEMIFSSDTLLEMTAKGANKGKMVKRLQQMLGCHTLICAGDHLNDLPMLSVADQAFCPENAQQALKDCGTRVVCHCQDGAIGEIIEILDRETP